MNPTQFVVIAGPNGAGKSTSAPALLPEALPYINADEIAKQLVETGQTRHVTAARRLLEEWTRLEVAQADLAVETTLASRSLAPRIRRLKESGYQFHLIFFWLPNEELAIKRVAERVRAGGHNIPKEDIRRRYHRGLSNFFGLYRPLADTWAIYRNLIPGMPKPIALGTNNFDTSIILPDVWEQINEAD